MADGYLNFDTRVDTGGFSKGTKNITSCLGGLKSALQEVAATAAAAFSVKQIINFGKASVTEIVSPLSTIEQAVTNAFERCGGALGQTSLTIPIYLQTRRGLRLLTTEIIDDINDIIDSTGNVPINI